MSRLTCVALVFGFFLWLPAGPGHAAAAPGQPPVEDLALMSLEQLMEVTVISTSKKEEKWFQSSSAVFVITQEDIRRSGILELPEIFRIVPGMQVARLDANKWGISARGFNGRFSNKLLVLVDGRTVYNDIFGGMVWDEYQLPLETIERIEVIRGPGGTLWGANAMNGVINIITKNAKDSQGAMITAGAGTRDRGFTTLRYGGRLAEDAYYRVYGKYFNQRA
ncbi:MAG: TonB-dependent receptor plug domain-containing protein, partial [Nitrospinaceae bacterium]